MNPCTKFSMTKKYFFVDCCKENSSLLLFNRKNRRISASSSRSCQHGMTLIIGLILLAMLMVISTIGFRNTTLSERMTGNAFDRHTSFQSAENAGKEALQVIDDAIAKKPTLNPISIAIETTIAAAVANAIATPIDTDNEHGHGHGHGDGDQNPVPAVVPDPVLGNYDKPLTSGGNTDFWTHGAGTTVTSPSTGCRTTSPFSWISCAASVETKYTNNAANAQYVIELLSAALNGSGLELTYRVTSRSTGGSGDAEVVLQSIYIRTI